MKKTNGKIQKLQKRIELDLQINDSDISRELKEQPAKYAYWGASHAIKSQEYLAAKQRVSQTEAMLGKDINQQLLHQKKLDSLTRMSDKVVKDKVYMHSEYQQAHRELLELGVEEGILGAAKEAFRQRSYMVLELARMERHELLTPENVMVRKLVKEYEKED